MGSRPTNFEERNEYGSFNCNYERGRDRCGMGPRPSFPHQIPREEEDRSYGDYRGQNCRMGPRPSFQQDNQFCNDRDFKDGNYKCRMGPRPSFQHENRASCDNRGSDARRSPDYGHSSVCPSPSGNNRWKHTDRREGIQVSTRHSMGENRSRGSDAQRSPYYGHSAVNPNPSDRREGKQVSTRHSIEDDQNRGSDAQRSPNNGHSSVNPNPSGIGRCKSTDKREGIQVSTRHSPEELQKMTKEQLIAVLTGQDVCRSEESDQPSTTTNSRAPERKVVKPVKPIHPLESYTYRDGVRANRFGGEQRIEKSGVSEVVLVETGKYGKQPIRVYSDSNKTDNQLALQARKNYNGKEKKKKKYAERYAEKKKKLAEANNSAAVSISSETIEPSLKTQSAEHCGNDLDSKSNDELSTMPILEAQKPIQCSPSKILLIGLSFNRSIMNQMKEKKFESLVQCTDMKGKPLEQSVLRDTWRCSQIEEQYAKSNVYTCNILQDSIRDIDDNTNMNTSCSSNSFVKQILLRNWTFNKIYVDTFRMHNSYLKEKFHIRFIDNLVSLARFPAKLVGTATCGGVVYLPFCPHFFYQVHSSEELKKCYSISYLRSNELGPLIINLPMSHLAQAGMLKK